MAEHDIEFPGSFQHSDFFHQLRLLEFHFPTLDCLRQAALATAQQVLKYSSTQTTTMNPLGTGVLLFSKPLSALALTASLASASLTIEQFEFLAGCLLLLFLIVAVHLAIPVSRFEYDKQALDAVPKESRGPRSYQDVGTAGDGNQQQLSQQQSRSKSINRQQQEEDNEQLQQPPLPSPPMIIRRDQPNGFIGDYDCNDADEMAAFDLRPTESEGSSGGGTTMTEATIPHQDGERNDQGPPAHIGMSGEKEMETEVAMQNEDPCGDIENDLVGEEEDGTAAAAALLEVEDRDDDERKDEKDKDDIDLDLNDMTNEGRDDDHDDSNDANTMEHSIELQPNQKRSVLALVSEGVIDRVQASNQRRALFLLDAKKVPYEKVDGMDPTQRKVRDALFGLAGFGSSGDGGDGYGDGDAKKRKPISYPQFFFVGDGAVSYVGDFERLLSLNDASDIPQEILDQHPELETWDRVFVNLVDPSEIASWP